MTGRVFRPAALRNCQAYQPDRRYGAEDERAVLSGRLAIMLLVLLCFVRAVVIPPCDMHHGTPPTTTESGSNAVTASAHDHSSSAPATERSDEHNGSCTCVGDCHPAAATPLAGRSPALVLAATVTVATVHRPTTPPSILPIARAYILPFATAPPTHEV